MTKAQAKKLEAALYAAGKSLSVPTLATPTKEELAADPLIGLRRAEEQHKSAVSEIMARIDATLSSLGYRRDGKYFISADDRVTVDIRRSPGPPEDVFSVTLSSRKLEDSKAAERRKLHRSLNRIMGGGPA